MAQERGKFVKVISREEIKKKISEGVYEPVVDRGGRPMEKMNFLIQLPNSNKEKFACFETFNTILMNNVSDMKVGSEVVVTFTPDSREWQGKYFTSNNASSVETERQVENSYQAPLTNINEDGDGLPF